MLVMVGEFRGVSERTVKSRTGEVVLLKSGPNKGQPWVKREVTLLVEGAGGRDETITLEAVGKELEWPDRGVFVALEVSVSTSVSERGDRVYREWKAWRRVPAVEAAVSELASV